MSQKPSSSLSYQYLSSFIFITLYFIGMIRGIMRGNIVMASLWGVLLVINISYLIYYWKKISKNQDSSK
ncbi:hypothetical protein ACFQ0W_08815 [Streptococcus saliviloxodontae]|uniref:hypothetical protein n=1 Tax=Streptococcus saliviloxodontae TaxID=1349416 RepID=UPI003645401F